MWLGKLHRKPHSQARQLQSVETIDVEFREHWGGIFAAHPWLEGPQDSYLGFWDRGGGASGEHSHAINLWQFFASQLGKGRIIEVSAAPGLHPNRGCLLRQALPPTLQDRNWAYWTGRSGCHHLSRKKMGTHTRE